MGHPQDLLRMLVEDLVHTQDVSREHRLALPRGPNRDIHRMSFGEVLRMLFGCNFAEWVVVVEFLD